MCICMYMYMYMYMYIYIVLQICECVLARVSVGVRAEAPALRDDAVVVELSFTDLKGITTHDAAAGLCLRWVVFGIHAEPETQVLSYRLLCSNRAGFETCFGLNTSPSPLALGTLKLFGRPLMPLASIQYIFQKRSHKVQNPLRP